MYLPYLSRSSGRKQQQTVQFGGINYSQNFRDGELRSSRNLTADYSPCLHPRAARKTVLSGLTDAESIFALNGKLYIAENGMLKEGDMEIMSLSPGKKHIVSVNTKIVVFPDQKWYDTETGETGTLYAAYQAAAGSIEFNEDGKTITAHIGAYSVTKTGSGTLGYQTTKDDDVFTLVDGYTLDAETGEFTFTNQRDEVVAKLKSNNRISKQYVDVGSMFLKVVDDKGNMLLDQLGDGQYAVITSMVRHQTVSPTTGYSPKPVFTVEYDLYTLSGESYGSFEGWEALGFKAGDTITISGCTSCPENNGDHTIREINITEDGLYQLVFTDSAFTVTGTEEGSVTFERKIPALDVVCEHNNRLWGAGDSIIYASALGDPTNWFTYDGLSTDAYAVAVAGSGDFTACSGYGSSVLFFKEDMLYKVLGDYPAEYALYSYHYPGVQAGSEDSLVNINEALYYKGTAGVWRYTGGQPDFIASAFGDRIYHDAAAGSNGLKYCIAMTDSSGVRGLWVYDTLRGVWLQEDNADAVSFCVNEGKLHFLDKTAGKVYGVDLGGDDEGKIQWEAEFCPVDELVHTKKVYSRLLLRADFETGSWLRVELSLDDKPWATVARWSAGHSQAKVIPILPRRCDRFRLRVTGEGNVMLRSLVREYAPGSEY